MFRLIFGFISTLVVLGLLLALLTVFGWDFGALIEWAWNFAVSAVGAIADWFLKAPWFQRAVS